MPTAPTLGVKAARNITGRRSRKPLEASRTPGKGVLRPDAEQLQPAPLHLGDRNEGP